MDTLILGIWKETRKTIAFVTHRIEEAVYLANTVYVMTPRPGTNSAVFHIDLPRPRPEGITMERKYFEIVAEIKRKIVKRRRGTEAAGPLREPGLQHGDLRERDMDQYDKELEEKVPEFEAHAEPASHGALDISATVTAVQIRGWKQVVGILAVAVLVIGGWELVVRLTKVPEFVFPTPSAIAVAHGDEHAHRVPPLLHHPGRARGRLRHRCHHRAVHGRRAHAGAVHREDHHAVHPAAGDHADDRACARC